MPLFDYECPACGSITEILVTGENTRDVVCKKCGGVNLRKLLSAHSSLSGTRKNTLPGVGDTACCGTSQDHAGCAGPGSCCGKTGI